MKYLRVQFPAGEQMSNAQSLHYPQYLICCGLVVNLLYNKFYNKSRNSNHTHHTRLTALFPGLPRWAGTRKVKTNLDFTEARDSEWQWHQRGLMQVCTLLQTDNHTSTPPLCFLQAGCPSCHPTNSVKALKAKKSRNSNNNNNNNNNKHIFIPP